MIDIADVKRLRLTDGELLVVKVDAIISMDQVAKIKAMFADACPALAGRVLVLDRALSLTVVDAGTVAGLSA